MGYANTMSCDSTAIDMPYAFSPLAQDFPKLSHPSTSLNTDHSEAAEKYESYFDIFLDVAKLTLLCIPPYVFLVLQISFRPPIGPALRPDTFSISNFTISDSKLAANWGWDADFSFRNPTEDLQAIIINGITGTLYYRDHVSLSSTSAGPFLMEANRVKIVHVSFATTDRSGNNQPATLEHCVGDQLSKERKTGTIHFTIKIGVRYKYKIGSWFWSSDILAYLHCWDLVVKFAPDTGKGRLIDGGQKDCPLSIIF